MRLFEKLLDTKYLEDNWITGANLFEDFSVDKFLDDTFIQVTPAALSKALENI